MPVRVKTSAMAATGTAAPRKSLGKAEVTNAKRQLPVAAEPTSSSKKAKTAPTAAAVAEFTLVLRNDEAVDKPWCDQRKQCRQVYEDIAGSEEDLAELCREVAGCKEKDELRALNSKLLQALVGASAIAESHRSVMKVITELGCESCSYYPCEECGELNHAEGSDKCVCGSVQ